MKIKDMPYERIDIGSAARQIRELAEEAKNAPSAEALVEIRARLLKNLRHIQSMASLASIGFTLNCSDEHYAAEKEHYDSKLPTLYSELVEFNRAFLKNPSCEAATKLMNPNVLRVYELTTRCVDKKIEAELAEDNRLVTEYGRLMAETEFYFKKRRMTFSELRKYFDDSSRAVRRAAYNAAGRGLAKISAALDSIFDKMVAVRTKMAKKMGFSSYAELGDGLMGRYSYCRGEVRAFRQFVTKHIVPLVSGVKAETAARLGIDRLMLYDNDSYFVDGNPAPTAGAEQMFSLAQKMYNDMGAEIGEFFDSMLKADAFDVFPRKGKWGGGYCTSVDDYDQPFILANFNGSSGDVDVLTHEVGHALAMYLRGKLDNDYELSVGTMSVAEIHSMSMEFLAWRYAGGFFGEGADDYRYQHLASSLAFIPYGCMVDEFEESCYNQPDLSPKKRNELWISLEKKYRPHLSSDGIDYLSTGTRWQYQAHIYENPMYYIDYCLAQLVAHQILLVAQKDYGAALDCYLKILKTSGEKPFEELVLDAGIASPLSESAVQSIAENINKLLKELPR